MMNSSDEDHQRHERPGALQQPGEHGEDRDHDSRVRDLEQPDGCRRSAPPSAREMPSKNQAALCGEPVDQRLDPVADRDLVRGEPFHRVRVPLRRGRRRADLADPRDQAAARPRGRDPPSRRRAPSPPSRVVTPASHAVHRARIRLEPGRRRLVRLLAVVEDLAHDLVLHRQVELRGSVSSLPTFGHSSA